MNQDQLNRLGELADQCDNYVGASMLPYLQPAYHVTQMRYGFRQLSKALKQLYVEATGENPWENEPELVELSEG